MTTPESRKLITLLAPTPSIFHGLQCAHLTFGVDASHQFMIRRQCRELLKTRHGYVWKLPHGQFDGVCMFDIPNTNLEIKVCAYRNGILFGTVLVYYDRGQLYSRGIYINDALCGIYSVYYQTGELDFQYNYSDGKRNGDAISFHKSGQIRTCGAYVDGKLHGPHFGYDVNGRLCFRADYGCGKTYTRENFMYYSSGEIHTITIYDDSDTYRYVRNEYYRSGYLHIRTVFEHELIVERTFYNQNGDPIA